MVCSAQFLRCHLKTICGADNCAQFALPFCDILLNGSAIVLIACYALNQIGDGGWSLIHFSHNAPVACLSNIELKLVYDKVSSPSTMNIVLLHD